MFEKILIANRGEIAVRIIRAAKELGIKTVAIYSEADKGALHTKLADEAYDIGPPEPLESYLAIDKIIRLAENIGAEAIHPGYGFLAENPNFAKECEKSGIKFIGPSSYTLERSGDKIGAKKTMKEADVPIIPGTLKPLTDVSEAIDIAENIGYPVMLKPVGGGGGIGMKVINSKEELKKLFTIAMEEAKAAFGIPDLFIEKLIQRPRHIEVQILADEHGNYIWLGERECSIQRRHQKLIEESPSPVVSPELRKKMGEAAIRAAKAIRYTNAGTIEFLYKDGKFYFLEVNARLQVEHGVTEVVTGIDIVKRQIMIASGEKLDITQDDVRLNGWAIESRINAEDPENNFLPSPGHVTEYIPPGGFGVRIDTYLHKGAFVPPYYDSLVSKLIVWGENRIDAVNKMKRALDEYVISGIKTTIPLHKEIFNDQKFVEGKIDTQFLERNMQKYIEKIKEKKRLKIAILAAAMIKENVIMKNNIEIREKPVAKKKIIDQTFNNFIMLKWAKGKKEWRKKL